MSATLLTGYRYLIAFDSLHQKYHNLYLTLFIVLLISVFSVVIYFLGVFSSVESKC